MIIGKDLSLTKKKLDYLRMKTCKGVRLRRVKPPFPLIYHLSTKCAS